MAELNVVGEVTNITEGHYQNKPFMTVELTERTQSGRFETVNGYVISFWGEKRLMVEQFRRGSLVRVRAKIKSEIKTGNYGSFNKTSFSGQDISAAHMVEAPRQAATNNGPKADVGRASSYETPDIDSIPF